MIYIRYLIILSVLSINLLQAKDRKINFEHITIKNGLSDGRIDCILQDSAGFLWFGTQDGLNRYDGYNFTVFDHDIFDSTSISSNWIRCIFEDQFHNLWIGTEGGGLNLFNKATEKFKRWIHEPGNSQSLSDNFVRTILEDSSGVLWIGTRSSLEQFDREKGIFKPLPANPSNSDSPPFNENVSEIFEDSQQNLWIGTQDNIYRYRRQNQEINHFKFGDGDERVSTIFEDSAGDLWIGTRYNGIWKFDRTSQKFVHFQRHNNFPNSLSSNEIKYIYEDADKNLWIATIQGGLNLFHRETGGFIHYQHDPDDPSSLSSNSVRTIYQDRTGVIWIGLDGSGIDSYVEHRQKFQLYENRGNTPIDLSPNTILAIFEDTDGILWIGTDGGGLNKFSRPKGVFSHYQIEKNNPFSISNNQVTCIFKDSEGTFWLGTKEGLNQFNPEKETFNRIYVKMSPVTGNNVINVITENRTGQLILGTNGGLISFDRKTNEFSHIDYDVNHLLNFEGVASIWIDQNNILWIGYLRSGVVQFNPTTHEYIHYRSDAGKPNSLSNNFVQHLYQDKTGRLWIATRKGLNRFIASTRGFHRYTKDDGLPSDVIVGILEDSAGNLWLSTTNGISKFNPEAETFTNYDVNDGLQGNQFWNRSCFKSQSGELFFGGNNGFNAFYPEEIEKLVNPYIPPIVITNVKILNRSPLQNSYAIKSGQNLLNLSYRENQISFEFAALDFTRPEKNQFAYMLNELENDWVYAGTRRSANYTNLPPGRYSFKVKGTNSDGVWNETGTLLNIYINTPFWKTWWAYLLYSLVVIGLIYGINAYIISIVRVRHDLKIERLEKEKVKEINQFKLQFFTDVAHEFKTPLTLIQAPLEEILNSNQANFPYETEVRLMYRNVKYLLRLVHQLLNFRKAERGKMELKASKGDMVQFAREVFELFGEMARKHQINYQFHSNIEVLKGWFDWEKIEEILVNLIDNAFKYTPDNGEIGIHLDHTPSDNRESGNLTIRVSDSGMGIGPEQIKHIFERFYQPREGHHSRQISSGLGLALTKRLVELHHGQIRVESQEGRGSCFTVILPLGKAHLAGHEIISDFSENSHFHSPIALPVDEFTSDTTQQTDPDNENRQIEDFRVLIVEDDGELRTYIGNALSRKYKITLAKDGQEGVELAKKILPDLIISDVMMPVIDGLELCRQLKSDFTTSHIPIILLTAKTMIEHKIEGIETGADDYIEKPFHFRFLEARIKNLLKSREKLRERYRKELLLEPAAVIATSADEKFLKKIREFIETNMANPELDVKILTRELGMSRTMLFVKLKELVGFTPAELIKVIRLEKAAQFLIKTDLTIGEIADKVGFSYSKYFSTCFLEKFKMTPTEYRSREGV